MTTKTTLIAATIALAGCATTDPAQQIGQAATTPLSDLNVVRAEIPPVLAAVRKAPYAAPTDKGCAALAADVQALDALLGADLDTTPTERNPSLIEREATDALRGAAEGVIPFRGWVRRLTGAERYARDVAAAIAAGTVRRAYLKGIAQALSCEPPAAPRAPGRS
jgi:outer membrane murein-binding lipoprotein Lpp